MKKDKNGILKNLTNLYNTLEKLYFIINISFMQC